MQGVQANERVTFRIAYEDDAVLVVEKPPRVVTLPGLGHEHDTLLNGLFATHGNRLARIGKDRAYGLLHRLDRETSGLVIVALTVEAYEHLIEQFRDRSVGKFYWAVCHKAPKVDRGVIRYPIEEYQERLNRWSSVKKARVSRKGSPALTAYRVIQSSNVATLIEARAVTGRLHQVRVHLDAIGCGILGDEWYGPRVTSKASPRLALHAHRVRFEHPTSGEQIDVRTKWPADLRKLLTRVKLERPDVRSEQGEHELGSGTIGKEDTLGGQAEP